MSRIEVMGVNFGKPDAGSEQDLAAMRRQALGGHFLSFLDGEQPHRLLAFVAAYDETALGSARTLSSEEQVWLVRAVVGQYRNAMPALADSLQYAEMANAEQARAFLENSENIAS